MSVHIWTLQMSPKFKFVFDHPIIRSISRYKERAERFQETTKTGLTSFNCYRFRFEQNERQPISSFEHGGYTEIGKGTGRHEII